MTRHLAHRGPDGAGEYVENGVALGHRRLAIIDIDGGVQPMFDKRGYAITFNGEIYNFRELREDLKRRGEIFFTDSDTEVLLKSYITFGAKCLENLNGIFAFCIVNVNKREVFFARDRIGVKPFFYSIVPNGFVFASEIKAVLACEMVHPEIDLSLTPFYLSTGYFPREFTPFKYLRQLRPGYWGRFNDTKIQFECYWDINAIYKRNGAHTASSRDKEELEYLIQEAVNMQTVSDVPIGAFLSGGIDSGIVTSVLAKSVSPPLKTFTVGISDASDMDERQNAKRVSELYGTDHSELQVSWSNMLSDWERLAEHFDQPFADLSMLPTYMVSKHARQNVKVVLSGDGGDEQWGGYGTYRRYLIISQIRRAIGSILCSFGGNAIRISSNLLIPFSKKYTGRLNRYSHLLKSKKETLYHDIISLPPPGFLMSLCGERITNTFDELLFHDLVHREIELGVDGVMLHDLQQYMVDDVLRKVDMMSMLVGLEVRVPLLDHRIVEKSVSLSYSDKITANKTKTIIRQIFKHALPASVIDGAKKGFGVPADEWFRGPLYEMAHSVLFSTDCRQRGVLDMSSVQKLWNDHQSGKGQYGKLIAILVLLENWLKRYE